MMLNTGRGPGKSRSTRAAWTRRTISVGRLKSPAVTTMTRHPSASRASLRSRSRCRCRASRLVLPTVVLDQDLEDSIDEISARQENAVCIVDVDVDFGHGQTRELHHQSHVGLSRGFDVLADKAQRAPHPANAVEVALHGELRRLVERRQAETHQPVAGTDQLDEGQLRGAVDEPSIRPGHGDAVDEVGVKPPLTAMEDNTWEPATEVLCSSRIAEATS